MSRPDQGLRFHGDTVAGPGRLDFAVNIVPEGPATTALAARHGRPAEEVVLLNGAAEALLAAGPGAAAAAGGGRGAVVHRS